MKKFIIFSSIFLLCFSSMFAKTYKLELSYGLGNSASIDDNELKAGSYQLNVSYYAQHYDTLSVGAGASYMWPAQYVDTSSTANPIDFIMPIYAIIKYELMPEATVEPYIIGKGGFGFAVANDNLLGADLTNGLYYSFGAGASFGDFFGEFTYDINQGSYSTTLAGSGEIDYKRFTLSIGYKIRFIDPNEDTFYNQKVEYVNPKRERTYDNVEIYDENGEIIERDGEVNNLTDVKIID